MAVMTVEAPGKGSFDQGHMHTRLLGQYNANLAIFYVSKRLITATQATVQEAVEQGEFHCWLSNDFRQHPYSQQSITY